jgi:predicted negative regulator of RcsB-dependent stress response
MPKQIKKITHKKTLDTETDVKDKLTTFVEDIKERRNRLAIYGVAVLVIIIGIVSFFIYSFNQQKTARQLEYDAYNIYYNEYQPSQITDQERYEQALDIFKKSYNTKKTPRALLYIASCYYELGKYDDVLKTLKNFSERYADEHAMIPLAYIKIAQVYRQKGEPDEALKTLDAFSHFKSDLYKDYALMESGRILEKEGKLEEAKDKFNEITARFPDSPFFEEAKSKGGEKDEEKKEG